MQNVIFELPMSSRSDMQIRGDLNFDQVRSAVSTASLAILDPALLPVFENHTDLILGAARRGLLIDAGHLPDAAIRKIGKRGADLTLDRAFDHPWGSRPWLLTHTWEPDVNTMFEPDWIPEDEQARVSALRDQWRADNKITTHLYLIEPASTDEHFGAVVTEYAFAAIKSGPPKVKFLLVPFAKVSLVHTSRERFCAVVEGPGYAINPGTAGSALNPMMTALLLLNTRGVETQTVAAPAMTNKARERKGKGPIPGYTRVMSADYVTAVLTKKSAQHRSSSAADTNEKRRSPIPHLRRGHIRTYGDGEQIWIRDMLVGVKGEDELSFVERHRAGYRIKRNAP